MTETATTRTSFRIPRTRAAASQQSAAAITPTPRRDPRLKMLTWLPRRVLQRGATPTRDDQRALQDLRAAQDRSDW